MSTVVTRHVDGVVLRYHPDAIGRHHIEQRNQISDRERIELLKAEREFRELALIAEHLDVAEYGRSRIYLGLARIQRALNIRRRECGMSAVKGEEAAW